MPYIARIGWNMCENKEEEKKTFRKFSLSKFDGAYLLSSTATKSRRRYDFQFKLNDWHFCRKNLMERNNNEKKLPRRFPLDC